MRFALQSCKYILLTYSYHPLIKLLVVQDSGLISTAQLFFTIRCSDLDPKIKFSILKKKVVFVKDEKDPFQTDYRTAVEDLFQNLKIRLLNK